MEARRMANQHVCKTIDAEGCKKISDPHLAFNPMIHGEKWGYNAARCF